MRASLHSFRSGRSERAGRAFTLIELLVVIGIIALLAGIAGPAIARMKRGDAMTAGVRQLLDDVGLARLRALNDHTTVYMVFVPPIANLAPPDPTLSVSDRNEIIQAQCTGYVLLAERQVGDQPGRRNQRFITSWKSLPEGVSIAREKFAVGGGPTGPAPFDYPTFTNRLFTFYYDNGTSASCQLPYIAFDYRGGLVGGRDVTIPLTKAAVTPHKDATGWLWSTASYQESPAGNWTNTYNQVIINSLTGRARHDYRRMQ